ncbi:hypothetical protein GGR53DRAFT_463047 [Hypoxylon sp. FL1150]|nr:hypothetical protein GGR53DRAFT_463047 [Hypoxylon sp. FL1150]
MDPNQQRPHPDRTSPPSSQTWLVTKLVLASLSIFCCIVVLGISIGLAADPAVQSYIVVWTAPQAGAALLWSAAESASLCALRVRPKRRDIHPGAHVAVHLLLWLSFGAGLGLTARVLKFAVAFTASDGSEAYRAYYYGDDDDGYEYYSDSYIHSMDALVAFLALLIIIHLVLFVRACVETIHIKRQRKTNAAENIELHQARLSHKDKQEDVKPSMA